MQVTHQNDHITHAVIGGGEAIDFGISSSAEFFNILSSTLYKNQILAVVREVLCNAWDAHIEAGITDKAVEITLTDTSLTIKDFGHGIHHDDMGLVYGTYGNSTKKNDGKQTGGFGLGCKAPFAYTDHFEVISCHGGVKTIYNLSKSSAQVSGKPGIIPIASFPVQEETGLQVTIPIKNLMDKYKFQRYIKMIVFNGDMCMRLDNDDLPVMGFDTQKANYLISSEMLEDTNHIIHIRYGNVVYPVESHDEYKGVYHKIVTYLERISDYTKKYKLVLQAVPHSISVTPSRESLSMQDKTVASLKTLLGDFTNQVLDKVPAHYQTTIRLAVDQAIEKKLYSDLLSTKQGLATHLSTSKSRDICTLEDLAKSYMASNYPSNFTTYRDDLIYRLQCMIREEMVPRGLTQTYIKVLQGTDGRFRSSWFMERIIAPLVIRLQTAKLNPHGLFALDDLKTPIMQFKTSYGQLHYITDQMYFLCNQVIVTTRRTDLVHRLSYKKDLRKNINHRASLGVLVYCCGPKKGEREAALKLFKDRGMDVIDMTTTQDWEPQVEKKVAVKTVAKEGLVKLSALGQGKDNHIVNCRKVLDEKAARILKPECIVQVTTNAKCPPEMLGDYSSTVSNLILRLFGNVCGVTNNGNIALKWTKQGVKPLHDYVHEKLCEQMLNPRIQEYWAFHHTRVLNKCEMANSAQPVWEVIHQTPVLRKLFGIINNLTPEDQLYVDLWGEMNYDQGYYANRRGKDILACHKKLEAIPLNDTMLAAAKRISGNPLIAIISGRNLTALLKDAEQKPAITQKVIDILMAVLK